MAQIAIALPVLASARTVTSATLVPVTALVAGSSPAPSTRTKGSSL